MANGHGGARPGAGRKPTRVRHAAKVASAERRIAAKLIPIVDTMLEIALKGIPAAERIEERFEPAGTIIVDALATDPLTGEVVTDARGNPTKLKQLAFPDKPADELILVDRKVVTLPPTAPDRSLLEYLADRIMGRPTTLVDAEDGGSLAGAALSFEQALRALGGHPNPGGTPGVPAERELSALPGASRLDADGRRDEV